MEVTTGRDGCGGPWSYRRVQTGSSSHAISSSSGTVSTTYTSSGSRPSFTPIEAAANSMHFDFEFHGEETAEEQVKRMKSLVHEFFGAPSANCSISGCDASVLERWFTELGVWWVLRVVPVGASAGKVGHTTTFVDTWSWIRALTEIMQTIRLTTSLISPVRGFVGMSSICEGKHDTERGGPNCW